MRLPGTILVLSGPSGVGKTTVADALARCEPDLVRVVTATTRSPRAGEVDGRDYHFHSEESFRQMIQSKALLEWAEVHGRFYGTPLPEVVAQLKQGKVVLLIIDVDGGRSVAGLDLDALLVFLDPPSLDALAQRIRSRGTESEDQIAKRLERVNREMIAGKDYHHRVVNDEVEACAVKVQRLVQAHRKALEQREGTLYPGLAKLGVDS